VEAYLTKGIKSIQMKWFLKYKKKVTIIPRDSFKYLEYRIYNSKKEELIDILINTNSKPPGFSGGFFINNFIKIKK
jgi:hypothetical protein